MGDRDQNLRGALGGLVVLVAALLACKGPAARSDELRADLTKRAKFDLSCPNGIELVPLQSDGDLVRSYGVTGCGKRASYVLTPDLVWVMNSAPDGKVNVDPSLMQPPPSPPPTPPPMVPPAPPPAH